jgi:uncharacterized protein YndB with AHSA1/START domain
MGEKTFTVERSTTIDAPPGRIYAQIADFHHWAQWSPWEDVDPQLQRTYSGQPRGAGAVYAWSGNSNAGQGRMEITDATEAARVDIDLVFEKPWKAHNDTAFVIRPEGAGSRVTWSMTGKKTLAMKLMTLVVSMDKLLDRDFEKGLARLKSLSEQPDSASSP